MCATIRARVGRVLLLTLTITGIAVVAATVGAMAADQFSDVDDEHPFHDEIGWLADTGISEGWPDGTFRPSQAVSRQAMSAFMHRLSGHASGIAPSVDAATVQGLTPAELGGDTSQIEARLDALEGRVDDLEADNAALEATVAGLEGQVADLQGLLAGVSRHDDAQGRDTLVLAGMNLQVVNGTGTTDEAPNGLGNLLIGYDTERPTDPDKTGSHYLVVGDQHNYTAFGGIVAGFRNTASGDGASVTGGSFNTASGFRASVTGGSNNVAQGDWASVTGGGGNTASGNGAWVSGGLFNTASGSRASVSGGENNIASGNRASVSAGENNIASGDRASVSGGRNNIAGGDWASVSGGVVNTASGDWSSVVGGQLNEAVGSRSSVTGGRVNAAEANWSIVVGGSGRTIIDSPANECDSQVGDTLFADTCQF